MRSMMYGAYGMDVLDTIASSISYMEDIVNHIYLEIMSFFNILCTIMGKGKEVHKRTGNSIIITPTWSNGVSKDAKELII
jgi:hypothetical protein